MIWASFKPKSYNTAQTYSVSRNVITAQQAHSTSLFFLTATNPKAYFTFLNHTLFFKENKGKTTSLNRFKKVHTVFFLGLYSKLLSAMIPHGQWILYTLGFEDIKFYIRN
jgi:hypothetical protein